MSDRQEPSYRADILVVDDQPNNVRLLSMMLVEEGYRVRKALDGTMALTAIETEHPDLILLDIMMPDLNGYEVCQSLQDRAETREIPIIFLSALDEPLDKVKAFQVGGADYISKPFQLEEVLARIENQLTIQRQKHQLVEQNAQLQQEIWERQQTEEVLYQSRALLSSVLNSSLDGVAAMQAVRDEEGNIADFRCLVVNPVAARAIGHTSAKVVGRLILKKLLKKIDPELFGQFIQVVETGEVLKRELCYQREEEKTWYHFVAVKLGDGFAVTFRDITEQKKALLNLQAANQELERLSTMDGLTQVANRRRFNDCFEREWKRAIAAQHPISLILCDVDCFKLYNDTYGHLEGDKCLKAVAQSIVRRLKRPGELVARYGGEEFIILLPNSDSYWVVQIAELIRADIKDLQIEHRTSTASEYLTVSLGMVNRIPTTTDLPNELLSMADTALYEAKNQGRDRAIFYNSLAESQL